MNTLIGTVVIALADDFQEKLLRTALLSMRLGVRTLEPKTTSLAEILALATSGGERCFLVLDPRRLCALHLPFDRAAAAIRSELPAAGVALMVSDRLTVAPLAARWARLHGARATLGRLSLDRYDDSLMPLVQALDAHFDVATDRGRLRDYSSALLSSLDRNSDPFAEVQRTWSQLHLPSHAPAQLIEELLTHAVDISDRSYLMRPFPYCFVGKEACDWLQRRLGVDRARAVAVGELLRQLGAFYHVTREHPFRDSGNFYRPNLPSSRLLMLDLDPVISRMRALAGLKIEDRRWRGQLFTQCFVGSEAVAWMGSDLGLTLTESITLGQSLLEAGIFRHVSDEHDFIDTEYFYRFALDR